MEDRCPRPCTPARRGEVPSLAIPSLGSRSGIVLHAPAASVPVISYAAPGAREQAAAAASSTAAAVAVPSRTGGLRRPSATTPRNGKREPPAYSPAPPARRQRPRAMPAVAPILDTQQVQVLKAASSLLPVQPMPSATSSAIAPLPPPPAQELASAASHEAPIQFNVGGYRFSVSRQLLRAHTAAGFLPRSSALACAVQAGIGRDGCYFLDLDGRQFHHVLNFLRLGARGLPPDLQGRERWELCSLAAALNLEHLVGVLQHAAGGDDLPRPPAAASWTREAGGDNLGPSAAASWTPPMFAGWKTPPPAAQRTDISPWSGLQVAAKRPAADSHCRETVIAGRELKAQRISALPSEREVETVKAAAPVGRTAAASSPDNIFQAASEVVVQECKRLEEIHFFLIKLDLTVCRPSPSKGSFHAAAAGESLLSALSAEEAARHMKQFLLAVKEALGTRGKALASSAADNRRLALKETAEPPPRRSTAEERRLAEDPVEAEATRLAAEKCEELQASLRKAEQRQAAWLRLQRRVEVVASSAPRLPSEVAGTGLHRHGSRREMLRARATTRLKAIDDKVSEIRSTTLEFISLECNAAKRSTQPSNDSTATHNARVPEQRPESCVIS
eukprot:TRINITY_DN100903_c0_g1_i1.p1 TRINITY_DN100903_c0_g1~~TRINITY_DN100903_c0_g1_i1.p1  ORF type:complete len:619 (-),score=128.83 TRINITY_DN100903_c0_g1_i1:2-1858(-)